MKIRRTSEYILAYALWGVNSALGVFIGFWAVRNAIRSLTELMTMGALLRGTSHEQFQVAYTRNAVERFSVIILGVLAVIMLVVIEHYYRTGVDAGQLLRRFLLVTMIESGVLCAALTIQAVFAGTLGLLTIWSLLVPLAVLAVTVGLGWLTTRLTKNPRKP